VIDRPGDGIDRRWSPSSLGTEYSVQTKRPTAFSRNERMMQRAWTFASSFMMFATVGVVACSSADEPEGEGTETGGTSSGGTSNGGSTSTGGTSSGGTSSGGSTSTGGTSSGGTSGTGGDAPNPDPECKGIKTGEACTVADKQCPSMPCGLADSGRRDCNCATSWSCTACDYTNSPFKDRPADIQACPSNASDEVACTTANSVCGPVGNEYCACFQDATDGLIWDCDKPPTSWM
jgi:hypothetical protein